MPEVQSTFQTKKKITTVGDIPRIEYHEMASDRSSEVFIRNMSINFYKKPTQLMIPMKWGGSTGGNTEESIIIPNTWIPIPLTDMISKEEILTNQHFRSLSFSGTIWFLEPREARKFIQENSEAKLALEHWKRQREAMSVTGQPLEEELNLSQISGLTNPSGTQVVTHQNANEQQNQQTVRLLISELVHRTDISSEERNEATRNLLSTITPLEANWLLANGQFSENLRDELQLVAQNS